jgi:hypothetical protein
MDQLFENWQETKDVLLEGLEGTKREITAAGLENAKQYMAEAATSGATAAGAIGDFRKILLPLIRRTLPQQIATELVGVQPMSGPVGLVYSLRFRYTDSQNAGSALNALSATHDVTAGDEMFSPSLLALHYSGDPAANAEFGGAGAVGDFEGGNILGSGNPGQRVDLQVLKQAVEAGTRKLSARWTIEAMQDLSSQHGLDVESELVSAMSTEITSEMDQEIILDLSNLATTVAAYDQSATTGTPTWIGDKHAALGTQIAKVSTEIARLTKRGGANWAVVSSPVLAVLQSANRHADFRGSFMSLDAGAMVSGPNTNVKQVGVLNGGIRVYHDSYNVAANDTIILGYKGDTEVDSGYFHAPYIPLMASQPVIDPDTFEPVIQLMTRYGKATFTNTATSLGNSGNYYGKVTVANLTFV